MPGNVAVPATPVIVADASQQPLLAPLASPAVAAAVDEAAGRGAAAAASSAAGAAGTPGTSPSPGAEGEPAAASSIVEPAAGALSSVLSALRELAARLVALLQQLAAAVQRFPVWVQAQQLKRLREAYEEDPKDADKHAAYLAELAKGNPREVRSLVWEGGICSCVFRVLCACPSGSW